MHQLTVVPEGGLGNRIYTITSSVAFTKKYNIPLTVIWFKDWGMGAGFFDLFTHSPAFENIEIRDARLSDFYKYNKPIKSNFFLPKLYQRLKFDAVYYWYKENISVEEWYLSHPDAHDMYLYHCSDFFNNTGFINFLSPVNAIQKRIDEQVKLISPYTIGVHIRRTDLLSAIIQSPLSSFINKMKYEIEINPETTFYIASDSKEEKKIIIDVFRDKIITVENNLERNTKEGIIDALIELHTLAATKKIFGSCNSTYSALASKINNIPIEIIQG